MPYLCSVAAFVLVGALGLAGCASSGGAGPTVRASALPHITVQREGGIAGATEVVTVDPTGGWVVTDPAGHRRTGRLTADQMATVAARAGDPRLADEARRSVGPSHCADAFNYQVAVDAVRVSYTDCPTDADPPTATKALVQSVTEATR